MSLAVVRSRAPASGRAPEVTVEVHLANGLPSFSIVGLPDLEVRESRERVRAALQNCGFDFPVRRITVNLAPADLPKESGRFVMARFFCYKDFHSFLVSWRRAAGWGLGGGAMARRPVDNFELDRWRGLKAGELLPLLADYVKLDVSFHPTTSIESTRWHISADGRDFEILCTDSKFFDTRSGKGGAGAVDLAMHLLHLNFKQAVNLLRARGV